MESENFEWTNWPRSVQLKKDQLILYFFLKKKAKIRPQHGSNPYDLFYFIFYKEPQKPYDKYTNQIHQTSESITDKHNDREQTRPSFLRECLMRTL
jgi:hypothetical protein